MPATASEWRKPVLSEMARDVVRDAMRARGKTVTALARELGISRKHLSNVLNGHAPLVDPLLRRLGEATGVGAELLFALLDYGSDEPRPEPFGFLRRLGEATGVDAELLLALLDYGRPPEPAPFGALRGWIVEHGDLTEPMEGWEMLEDE